jgi:hypothetical protein
MDPAQFSESTRRQLDALPPEKRAHAEAILAKIQSPEYRAREVAERRILDAEYRETGRIATVGESTAMVPEGIREFLSTLRREREARGLSLADVADRSGIGKAALSRLENGLQPNPTLATIQRYAEALGKRVAWRLEDAET